MNKTNIFKYIFIPFFLVGITIQTSNADPLTVNVLSSYYHIWGDAYANDQSQVFNYDITAITPISKHFDIVLGGDGSAQSGNLYRAYSDAFDFGVQVNTASWNYDGQGFGSGFAHAYAEAEWVFQPLNAVGQLSFALGNGGAWTSRGIFVEDLTTGVVLLNGYIHNLGWTGFFSPSAPGWDTQSATDYGEYFSGIENGILISASDTYRVCLYAASEANGDSQGPWITMPDVQAVPEPATMLLLGCGLIGLAGLRRKFKK